VLLLAAEQVGETGSVVGVDMVPAMLARAEKTRCGTDVSETWNSDSAIRSNWTSDERHSTSCRVRLVSHRLRTWIARLAPSVKKGRRHEPARVFSVLNAGSSKR
jgi:hypothetical protein